MISSQDASKQKQEIAFSRKAIATTQGTIYFENILLIRKNTQKHLDLFLGSKLKLFDHISEKN